MSVIVIAFVLIIPLYITAVETNKRVAEKELLNNVSKRFDSLQATFSDTYKFASKIANSHEILKLSLLNDNSKNMDIALYNVLQARGNYMWDFDFIQDYYIQFANNQTLVKQDSVYWDKALFYTRYINSPNMTFDSWQNELFQQKLSFSGPVTITKNSEQYQDVLYINYYFFNPKSPRIVVSFVLSTDAILSYLLDENIQQYGTLSITQQSDSTHYTISFDNNWSSDSNVATRHYQLHNTQTNMTLDLYLTEDFFTAAVLPIQRLLILYIAAFTIVIVSYTVYLTICTTRPFHTLVNTASSDCNMNLKHNINKPEQIFDYFCESLTEMRASEEQIKTQYEQDQQQYNESVVRSLMKGLPVDGSDTESVLCELPVFNKPFYLAAILLSASAKSSEKAKELIIAQQNIRELWMNEFRNVLFIHSRQLFILFNDIDDRQPESLAETVNSIRIRIIRNYDIELQIGISGTIGHPPLLNDAYKQVSLVINYLQANSQTGFMQYVPLLLSTGKFSQPLWNSVDAEQLSQRILNYNPDNLIDLFTQAKNQQNNESFEMSFTNLHMNYYSILSVIKRIAQSYAAHHIISLNEYDRQMSSSQNINALKEQALKLQSHIHSILLERENKQTDEVVHYIHEHYFDPLFCLTSIADYFNVTERNISNRVREKTGRNYTEYISMLRMEQAKSMLAKTNTSIADIALQVGYDKLNSFYKIFKQSVGVPPKVYREQNTSMKLKNTSYPPQ
jgi:AraC-like DNA-binding protein